MERIARFGFGLIYRAFNHGRSNSQRRRQYEETRFAREKVDVVEQRPPPLPPTCRNLSQTCLTTHPQTLSLSFTKPPPEIRQSIYELVPGGSVTHLVHGKKRIVVHHRSEVAEEIDHSGQVGIVAKQEASYVDWINGRNEHPALDQCAKNLLSLLRTRLAIYAEAISVLSNSNVFATASPLVLIYLHDHISPCRGD